MRRWQHLRWRAELLLLCALAASSSSVAVPAWPWTPQPPSSPPSASQLRPPGPRSIGVYNGAAAAAGQFPFAVALLANGKEQYCAGSLVHPSAVLTAAHCVLGVNRSGLRLVLNATDYRAAPGSPRLVRGAASLHAHPGFNDSQSPDFDVAVAVLDSPVPASSGAVPVALVSNATASLERAGTNVTVLGWGLTEDHRGSGHKGDGTPQLRFANLTVVALDRCHELFPPPEWCCPWPKLSPNMMCSYDISGRNASTCEGDSGGPLMAWRTTTTATRKEDGSSGVGESRTPVQVGIVSWGTLCGGPPDVYQRVLQWRDWIDRTIVENVPG